MRNKKQYQFNLLATYYDSEDFIVEAETREEAEEILHSKTRDKWSDAMRVEFILESVNGNEEDKEVDDCYRDYYDQ